MTSNSTEKYPAAERARLLDRLVVRADVIRRGYFLLFGITATAAFLTIANPVIAITDSRALAGMVIMLGSVFPILFVAAGIRAFYCFLRPYLTPRWLAAAHATFGEDIMTPVLAKLRVSLSPDHVLRRADLIDAIYLHRLVLSQAREPAQGLRTRDILGQR